MWRVFIFVLVYAGSSQDEAGEGAAGEESEAAVQMVLNGAVATVVYKQATAELPKEVATRKRFLDILSEFSFPGVAPIYEVSFSQCKGDECLDTVSPRNRR